MNLKKAAKGVDSDDLETRVRSSIFLLNLEGKKEGKNKIHYGTEIRNVIFFKLMDDVSSSPNLMYQLTDIDNKKSLSHILRCIATEGKEECGLAAVQMLIFSENLDDEAKSLGHIIAGTPNESVKNEAIKSLSASLNVYLKFKNPTWIASYSSVAYVASYGDTDSSARAFNEIINCRNFDTKIHTLHSMVNYHKSGKLYDAALGIICDSFDQIVERSCDTVKSIALKTVVDKSSDENLALKALEKFKDGYDWIDIRWLELVAEYNKNPVIAAKAKEYLIPYKNRSLGDKIISKVIMR